jgi:hypothetical protein
MNQVDLKELNIQPFGQVHHDYIGYQSLTDVPKAIAYSEAEYDLTQLNKLNSTAELIDTMPNVDRFCQINEINPNHAMRFLQKSILASYLYLREAINF